VPRSVSLPLVALVVFVVVRATSRTIKLIQNVLNYTRTRSSPCWCAQIENMITIRKDTLQGRCAVS
jgi:hypothetical protein